MGNIMNLKKLTSLGLFTALALIIFALESAIPPLIPIPGIKLGLANIITLVLLRNDTAKNTLLVLLMRIFLASFFFGQGVSFLYSLTGGLLCFGAMYAVNKLLQGHYIYLTSIIGAVFHNLGQIAVAYLITQTAGIFAYLPFLLISGIITGLFTGLSSHYSQVYLAPIVRRFSK